MRLVLANGCFDPLHPGHVEHLIEARSLGDCLMVSLTLDEHFHKGPKRPYLKWDERRLMLEALRCVDYVVPSENAWEAIRRIRPDVFVKGEDWRDRLPAETLEACKLAGTEIVFTTAPRFGTGELVRRMTR